ncbi:MAG: radical SAM protein [Candidatus Pacearchaeota archaeon]
MKTKFDSYCINGIAEGCKYCLKGEKLVLFMGGKCSRNCWYCSLSNSRKKCHQISANERQIKRIKDIFKEIKESNAKGIGITGGDPMVYFRKLLKILKKVRKKFNKSFHIHIYLPLGLVTLNKIKKLSLYINEFRFHPSFLISPEKDLQNKEKNMIKEISKELGKNKVGLELPLIPDKEKEIISFVSSIKDSISFLNLNEFEISETNFNIVTENYQINKDTYTIFDSKKSGLRILNYFRKDRLKIHLCTAKTKDLHQYINRLKNYKTLPFGHKTKEGNVIYFAVYPKNIRKVSKQISKITKNYYVDNSKKRVILNIKDVEKVYLQTGLKIARVLEPPTYNSEYLEFSYIDE